MSAASGSFVARSWTKKGPAGSFLASFFAVSFFAAGAGVGIALDEAAIPVPEAVASACGFLGLDPLQVANEGKLVAFVDPAVTEAVLAAMRARPDGVSAAVIGRVVAEHPGMAVGRTSFGTTRVIERELGEQLPRIC